MDSNQVSLKSIYSPLLNEGNSRENNSDFHIHNNKDPKLKLDCSMITIGLVTFVGDAARGILVDNIYIKLAIIFHIVSCIVAIM